METELPGFAAELRLTLADRWLAERGLAEVSGSSEVLPKPEMMRTLRRQEIARLTETLSRQLNAIHVPHEPGSRISGVYERAITTPMGKLAIIRREDTFTLAPGSRHSKRCAAVPSWVSPAPIGLCDPRSRSHAAWTGVRIKADRRGRAINGLPCVANKIAALLDVLTLADVEALPPAERRRFADQCRHWAELAEPRRTETPKAGVLLDLKHGPRDE